MPRISVPVTGRRSCLWHKRSQQMVWLIRSTAEETCYLSLAADVIASWTKSCGWEHRVGKSMKAEQISNNVRQKS
jgi:hypothetical protein